MSIPEMNQFHELTDRSKEIKGELFLVAERLHWDMTEFKEMVRYLSNEPKGETMPRCETEYR